VTRRLAAVFAHPDDDAFSVFGTIALHLDEGIEVLSILATRGEAGPISDPSLATRETLGQVREAEARRAYASIGLPDPRLHFLGYPDMEWRARTARNWSVASPSCSRNSVPRS